MPNAVLWNMLGPWESFFLSHYCSLSPGSSQILSLLSSLEVPEAVTNGGRHSRNIKAHNPFMCSMLMISEWRL